MWPIQVQSSLVLVASSSSGRSRGGEARCDCIRHGISAACHRHHRGLPSSGREVCWQHPSAQYRGGGGLGITCQPPPLPRKHSASKSCSNSIRLTRHQRKRMVAELNPFRCSNSHHWCDAFNHLHYPRAGYSRASATWASACVLSPPSLGHSRWGPWTGGHTALKELLHFFVFCCIN